MRRTGTTAHALLGLLALRPAWSTYELNQQMQRNLRFFWPRAESRIYADALALVERGWAATKTEQTGRRTRTIYRISRRGRAALSDWLATPPRATALECEALLRVFLADHAPPGATRAALDQVRADAEAILAVGRRVSEEYAAGTAPFQDQVHIRSIVFDFLSHHAMMLREWADRAEATIASWEGMGAEERAVRAIEAISTVRAKYPD
ncbi:MAG TPA: PadR family transcriptional regulator [Mycobacteriales bacterium]|nr:PadR family transcriptional regulator [Mycobacteriales bacterium]